MTGVKFLWPVNTTGISPIFIVVKNFSFPVWKEYIVKLLSFNFRPLQNSGIGYKRTESEAVTLCR